MPLHPSLLRSKGSKQKLSTSTSTWEPFSMTSLTGLRTCQFCSRKRINVCISLRGIIRSTWMIFWRPSTKQSIIWYNSLCFFNSLRIVDAAKLHWVVKTASMLIGSEVTDGDTHYEQKVLRWLQAVLADDTFPLNDEHRLQSEKCQICYSHWKQRLAHTMIILMCETTYCCFHLELLGFTATAAVALCVCVCVGGGGGVHACVCVCVCVWGGGYHGF